nr:MAG TPA: hypothetical protein [Caudoviricetes sp.]
MVVIGSILLIKRYIGSTSVAHLKHWYYWFLFNIFI